LYKYIIKFECKVTEWKAFFNKKKNKFSTKLSTNERKGMNYEKSFIIKKIAKFIKFVVIH